MQFTKTGNTCKQLFHAWRTLHSNEDAETIDAYVQSIRHVGAMLNYVISQILEVFKTITLTFVLGTISKLREKDNEQWHKAVVFNESNIIVDKIGNLTSVIGKLSTQNRQSKPIQTKSISR